MFTSKSLATYVGECYDFQQCARKYTSFDFETNGGKQEHQHLMKGRPFRVMLVKNGIWVHGKVSHWLEFYNHLEHVDSTHAWVLVADLEAAGNVSVGAIVRDKIDVDSDHDLNSCRHLCGLSIVKAVDPDENTCHLASSGTKTGVKAQLASLEPFHATQITLVVHRMNVQGGGTILACQALGLNDELISFEWTSPFVDDSNHSPAPDTFPLTRLSAAEDDVLRRRKADMMEYLRNELEQLSTVFDKIETCVQLYLYRLRHVVGDAEGLQKEIMCVPFVLYGVLLRSLIIEGHLSGDYLASAKIIVAMTLQQAEEAKKQVHEFTFLIKLLAEFFDVPKSASPSALVEQIFCYSLYRVLAPIGEWFEIHHEDFRTAIWCYSKAQEVARSAPFPFNGPSEHAHLINVDTMNIGVAYRRMGDFLSAAKYYEKAFALPSPTTSSRLSLLGNAKTMQITAPEWVGTSGYLTPWETGRANSGSTGECASCGAANARSKCGSCKLVFYCNTACQKAHWKSAHQYTCLFKMMGIRDHR